MLTAGSPARSSRIPSAKLAALQEPQSPIPATTKSQCRRICWTRLCSTGVPKYPFWNITNSRTPKSRRNNTPTSASSTDAFGLALSSSPTVSPRNPPRGRGASVVSTARSLAPVGSSSFSRISVSPALLHDPYPIAYRDRHRRQRQHLVHRKAPSDLLQPEPRAPAAGASSPPQQCQVGHHRVHAPRRGDLERARPDQLRPPGRV